MTETGVCNVKLEDGDRTLEFTHLWLSSPKQSGMLVQGLRDSGGIWDTDAEDVDEMFRVLARHRPHKSRDFVLANFVQLLNCSLRV